MNKSESERDEATMDLIARRIAGVMNSAVEADKTAIRELVEHRVGCNKALAEHPSIQVAQHENLPQVDMTKPGWSAELLGARGLQRARGEDHSWSVGLLGILNGIAGALPDGYGRIEARFEVACRLCPKPPADKIVWSGKVVGDPCPRCGKPLVLGDLLGFELSDVEKHSTPKGTDNASG